MKETDHTSQAPDVNFRIPLDTKDDFWRAVGARLDVVCGV